MSARLRFAAVCVIAAVGLGALVSLPTPSPSLITFRFDQPDAAEQQVALIGNDGGVYQTRNARAPVSRGARAVCPENTATIQARWESLNRDRGITQFYHDVPFPDGSGYIGGTQDNGTLLGGDDAGTNAWRTILGGDGTYAAVDPADTRASSMRSGSGAISRSRRTAARASRPRGAASTRSVRTRWNPTQTTCS